MDTSESILESCHLAEEKWQLSKIDSEVSCHLAEEKCPFEELKSYFIELYRIILPLDFLVFQVHCVLSSTDNIFFVWFFL